MRRMILQGLILSFVATLLGGASIRAAAQEASTEKAAKEIREMKLAAAAKLVAVYRIDYTVREMEDGKVLNSRKYTLMAREGAGWARSRVGSQVPISMGEKGVSYRDVGMNIDCLVSQEAETILVNSRIESSSVVPREAGPGSNPYQPIFRQVSSDVTGAVTLGKPTIIGSMDDVTSNHRFEIEVTVTKVK